MDWKLFFYLFLTNKEIFFEFIDLIDEKGFNNAVMANLFILIRKFVAKYKKQPDFDTLPLLLDRLPEQEKEHKKAYLDFIEEIGSIKTNIDIDVFKEELHRAIQTHDLEKFILKTANKVGQVTFEDVLGDIRQIMTKHHDKNLGIDVTDAERGIKLIRHDSSEKISSGFPALDKLLYGGYGVNEIAIVIAPPGRGKSFFLLNAMYNALLTRHNVLYVTCELAERAVLRRLYSRISFATKKEMTDEAMVIKAVNRFFTLCKAQGRIVYFPSKGITVEGLEALIEQQQLYFDFRTDMLIVDYLDLLAPRTIDQRLDIRHRLRGITEDLRSISLRRNIPVITATQSNRESLSKKEFNESHIAESFGKVEVADVVLAMCQTQEEKENKTSRLIMLKNRDNPSGGRITMYVDFERMVLMDEDDAVKLGLIEDKVVDVTGHTDK